MQRIVVIVAVALAVAAVALPGRAIAGEDAPERTLSNVAAALVAGDPAPVMELVEFVPRECSDQGHVDNAPLCRPGLPQVQDSFYFDECESFFYVDSAPVVERVGRELGASPARSLFAIIDDPLPAPVAPGHAIVLTQGATPSYAAPATIWYVSERNTIVGMAVPCFGAGDFGAVQLVDSHFPSASYAEGPHLNCPSIAGSYVNASVEVDALHGGPRPQFVGHLDDHMGGASRAIVYHDANTRYHNTDASLSNVRLGDELVLDGWRQADCTVLAYDLALRPPEASGEVSMHLFQDIDGDGQHSFSDIPAPAIVELISPVHGTFRLMAPADAVKFYFYNMPPGDYTLHVGWPAGFVPAFPVVNDPDDYRISFRMGADGRIDRELPSRLLLIAANVVTADVPASPFDVGAAIDARPPVIPPNTGAGPRSGHASIIVAVAVLTLFAGALLLETARRINGRGR